MTFITIVVVCLVSYYLGYIAGKRRIKMIVTNWTRYRIVESAHNRLDKLCLPLLENLRCRIKDA